MRDRSGGTESDLSHDDVLTLLDELVLGLDDGLEELEVLDVSAVGLDAVDKVLHHALVDLAAQLEVVHEDVLHGDRLQDLEAEEHRTIQLSDARALCVTGPAQPSFRMSQSEAYSPLG